MAQGITGTGTAATVKGGLIVTGTGLLFATAADRKVHVYDSATGAELATLPLGGPTSGQPVDVRAGRPAVPARDGVDRPGDNGWFERIDRLSCRADWTRGVCVAGGRGRQQIARNHFVQLVRVVAKEDL